MTALGRREVVGLAGLAAALLATASFVLPASSSGAEPRPISLGVDVARTADADATPSGVTPLPDAGTWALSYQALHDDERSERSTGATDSVDLYFAVAPGPNLTDDAWLVEASAAIPAGRGRYAFTVEHRCDVHVFVDGEEVASQTSASTAQSLVVTFEHRSRAVIHVRVEARDVGGPFVLKIRPGS